MKKKLIVEPSRPAPDAERRNPQSHKAVLEAAQRLLQAKGYSSITVDQIAAEAGVGKATIYRWWSSKAAVFMELYSVLAAELMMLEDTGTIEGDLRTLIRGAFKLFRESVAGLALAGFVAEAQSNPAVSKMLRQAFSVQRRQQNMLILQRAILRGEIVADIPVDVVSDVITGAVYYGVLIGDCELSDARADCIVQTVLAGIRVQPEAGKGRRRQAATRRLG